MDLKCGDVGSWKEALAAYDSRLESLKKPDLAALDAFYHSELPALLRGRDPESFITKAELSRLMKWKLARGKWRPRLMGFIDSLEETRVESASRSAFRALPDLSEAISELTVLKGVGPATASAVLAAYAPDVAPFMSDEAMEAALGSSKEYSLKQYLAFAEKLQGKANELSVDGGATFTPSDVERALWSSAIGSKVPALQAEDSETRPRARVKRKRL